MTYHRVLSFQEHANKYLQTLHKGYTVYVEAGFELREPLKDADPTTPQGQRQIFLRHGWQHLFTTSLAKSHFYLHPDSIRLIGRPKQAERENYDDSNGDREERV